MPQKIVLTGAPGTGKSTIINLLIENGYLCKEEISREIIKEAERQGDKHLFLNDPLLFSKAILDKRIEQYNSTQNKFFFFDRGIPDVTAYLNYINQPFDTFFKENFHQYTYDVVFIFPPWEKIYTTDAQRFETFEEAMQIHTSILEEYQKNHAQIITVPLGTPKERLKFILENCNG